MDKLLTPPPGGDQDRSQPVIIVYWTLWAICVVLLLLRFYSRITLRTLGWDDWVMAVAVLVFLGLTITGTFMMSAGGARHLYYIISQQGFTALIRVLKFYYMIQPMSIMAIAISRTSVAALLLRIFTVNVWRQRFLWFSIVSTLLISSLVSILITLSCSPVEGSWNPLIAAKCWDPKVGISLSTFSSSWNVFMDFALALLPVSAFWTLQMNHRRRVGLSLLMSLGIIAGIAGAIKASKLYQAITSDQTWNSYDLFMWNVIETFLIIFCGCMPTLKPVYDRVAGVSHALSTPKYSVSYPMSKYHRQDPSSDVSHASDAAVGAGAVPGGGGARAGVGMGAGAGAGADQPGVIKVATDVDVSRWEEDGDGDPQRRPINHQPAWVHAQESRESMQSRGKGGERDWLGPREVPLDRV